MNEKNPRNVIIGKNIRYYRVQYGMTIELLAEFTNSDPKYLTNIENGLHSPSLEKVLYIAYVLDVSIDNLVEGTEDLIDAPPREEIERRVIESRKRYKRRIRKKDISEDKDR